MKLKNNFLNQFKMLLDLIVMSIIYFFIIYYLPCHDFKLIFFLLIPYFIFFFFPVLFLHLNYLNQDSQPVFINEGCLMVQKNKNEFLKYNSGQILDIKLYINGSKGTVNGVLAFSNYYYAKINLWDGSSLIITSLYSSKIDRILKENFKDVKIKTEKVFYPIIRSIKK